MKRILAWGTVAVLGAWIAAHAVGIAWGGLPRVIAWLFVLQILPIGAALWFVPALGWLAWRRKATAPHALVLVLSGASVLPAISGFGLWPIAYPFGSLATSTPAATVRLPTDAEMVVGWGGDDIATNYHAMDSAQRWAYDLLVEPAGNGSKELADYGCYGVPVVAPAAGTVTVAVDGHPDGVPGQLSPDWENPAGNHVAIRLDTGTHLVIAHLQPGSLAVAVGDEVVEGQLLGRCGNSGNTSEPHVHLHHQRQDPAAIGLLAEGLPLFFRDLDGRDGAHMPTGGFEVVGEQIRLVGERVRHRR